MSDVTLRRARADDADGFQAVLSKAYAPWLNRLDSLPDLTAGVVEDIAAHVVWLAERGDGAIAGGVVLTFAEEAHVANLGVSPDCAGLGIGKALMKRAEAEALERGYSTLRLATHRDMTPTLRFYERAGWTETGREGVKVLMQKRIA